MSDQEYLSKCKKKIKKAIIDNDRFVVTERKVQIWFNIINKVLFKNSLPKFCEINIVNSDEYQAMCECSDDGYYKLLICESFKNKKNFVEIMSHEMIHLYEWIEYGRMTHGKNFFAWKQKMEKYGLKLYRTY